LVSPSTRWPRTIAVDPRIQTQNQIELHPWLPQSQLREFHDRHGIVTSAWSPLGNGQLLTATAVATVAQRHRCTPAQVLLRWNLDFGNVVLTKSTHPDRARSNLEALRVVLTEQDRQALAGLDSGKRTGPDPAVYGRPAS